MITQTAKAKLNLSLRVLGRRMDGYHELVSLVAFAEIGDTVVLDPSAPFDFVTNGPFASRIDGENLILKAVRAIRDAVPQASIGRIVLTKNLPVAAGLGGGSADVAAFLRAILEAQPDLGRRFDVPALARMLGADVSVCLKQRPAIMWGVGEQIADVSGMPRFWLVLANPGVPLSTAAVFKALAAPPLSQAPAPPALPGPFSELADLVGFMRAAGNDLQAASVRLCPVIADVLAGLGTQPGCLLAAQSGSGPTCFGCFATGDAARAAASSLSSAQPGWWIATARCG